MRINSIYRSAFKANVAKFFNRSNIVEEKLYIKTEQHKKRIKKKHNDKTSNIKQNILESARCTFLFGSASNCTHSYM